MKPIPISECKEGHILAENIVSRYGTLLVVENTELNGFIINRLFEMGINRIKVYRDPPNSDHQDSNIRYRRVEEYYKNSILDIKSVVGELAAGKPHRRGGGDSICVTAEYYGAHC